MLTDALERSSKPPLHARCSLTLFNIVCVVAKTVAGIVLGLRGSVLIFNAGSEKQWDCCQVRAHVSRLLSWTEVTRLSARTVCGTHLGLVPQLDTLLAELAVSVHRQYFDDLRGFVPARRRLADTAKDHKPIVALATTFRSTIARRRRSPASPRGFHIRLPTYHPFKLAGSNLNDRMVEYNLVNTASCCPFIVN